MAQRVKTQLAQKLLSPSRSSHPKLRIAYRDLMNALNEASAYFLKGSKGNWMAVHNGEVTLFDDATQANESVLTYSGTNSSDKADAIRRGNQISILAQQGRAIQKESHRTLHQEPLTYNERRALAKRSWKIHKAIEGIKRQIKL